MKILHQFKFKLNIHKYLILIIYFSLFIFIQGNQEDLINIPIKNLNTEIKNEEYTTDHFQVISLYVNDKESYGVEIEIAVSTKTNSPYPFTSIIKYLQLTSSFTHTSYLFHIEMHYLFKLNRETNNIFSFSCKNEDNCINCGFYLSENILNFVGNSFEKSKIDFNNNIGYILQNNSNTLVHYMSFDNITYLIVFYDLINLEIKPMILKYNKYKSIKCINYNDMNFFCLFVKQMNDNVRTINIKYFNITKFKYIEEYNDKITDNTTDNNTDTDNDKIIYDIDESLSFNLNLINNYAFDFYRTDDNHLITCFLINEDNLQKIICYKNTFEETINSSITNYPIYKSCDIKKDNKPEYFNYEKISIIYCNNEQLKANLYTFNNSKQLIIDLNSLSSYITSEKDNFIFANFSNAKKEIYILKDLYLTTTNDVQNLNLLINIYDKLINTILKYPLNSDNIYDNFFLEDKLGEIQLTKNESLFTLGSYSEENLHFIKLNNKTGITTGTYKYKDIPSNLVFKYKFIIYPDYCNTYTEDASQCLVCDEGSVFLPDNSMCYPPDKTPSHYYFDSLEENILKCDPNCFKCNMLKTGGYSGCIACDDNYLIYRFSCVEECPSNSYFYSYKKNIIAFNYEEIRNISVCIDNCEEGYTGFIYQDNINETLYKVCILNKYEIIIEAVEQRFNEFLTLSNDKKKDKIIQQADNIQKIENLTTGQEFNNFNLEFLLLNYYISNYNTLTTSKNLIILALTESTNYYYNLTEKYFDSLEDNNLNILNNKDDNLIYFLSSLSSLHKNEELLEINYKNKLKNYFFTMGQKLTDIPLNDNEMNKINAIMHAYIQFINKTIYLAINSTDSNFDPKEFESNKFYRYKHEIILGENNIKIMNLINNLFQFLLKFNKNLYYYKNSFISFYSQRLYEIENDQEYIIPQLGLSLVVLGSNSNITTEAYNTNNISESIENKKIDEFKIILPSLKSINKTIDWNTSSFGFIVFKEKYPLLYVNSTPYVSPDFYSINLYDKNKNIIKISNLNNKNSIKIVKKKSENDISMGNCVYYDESIKNLNDIGCKSFDLVDYIICTTNHLSDFTISSFSPSYIIENSNEDKESSNEEKIRNSHWITDTNIFSLLETNNAIILYINITIILLCILLLIIKFLTKPEYSKSDKIVEDSYVRYTINDDTETDKKILKYIIEKEIVYILKNRSDYENQKKQEMALDANKNDIFNSDQKVITIIEDDSDDDDDEEINEKKIKKVSFRSTVIDNKQKIKKKGTNIKRMKTINKKKGKNKEKSKEISIEMSNIKEDNDFIEIDETNEDVKNSNKYKYNFNYKNNSRKSNLTNGMRSNLRTSSYSQIDNIINEGDNTSTHIVKKQSISQRFKKNVKEQKSRHIYSILDKTLNEFKNTGQNSIEASPNVIKRPSSLIGISNALNKVNNKEEEKILIKNEFFVIFKIILYILFQYEYRLISLFNRISLPITRNNLIFLFCFRLNLQLTICMILSPRYFEDNYSLSNNILSIFLTLLIADVIYTIIEIILMKKKISTSTDNKKKGIIKFKQIMECLMAYIFLVVLIGFGICNSLWISLYLERYDIDCCYLANYCATIILDYLIYEIIILSIKSFIFTYVIYKDSEGCILKLLEIFNRIFIFYLAE